MPVIWQYFVTGVFVGWVAGGGTCILLVWLSKKKIQRDTKKAIKQATQMIIKFREKWEAHEKEMAGMAKTTEKYRHKADWN